MLLFIIVLQLIIFFFDYSNQKTEPISQNEWSNLERETDSLQKIEPKKKTYKLLPFNPNFITDFKGYILGLNSAELDRLYQFRKQGKYVNSAKDFQRVTKVSDNLLLKIKPYFKFPKWITTKKKTRIKSQKNFPIRDINKVNASDLRIINGIGEKLSSRIIAYRTKLQGFSYNNQLYEVWGLDRKIADEVLKKFVVKQKPIIKKINVNTATFKEVLRIIYIDYKLCKKIFNYRDEVAELQSIDELKNIEGFPLDKFKKITLYLEAK